jgi:hypothetical protein
MAFNVKQLLIGVAVAAIGLAALINADRPLIAEFANLFTLVTLIVLGYGVWTTEGDERAFRCGFVGWGGIYFVATKWWSIVVIFGTYQMLALASHALLPERITKLRGTSPVPLLGNEPYEQAYSDWLNRFDTIGQCLITLLFGLIGGWVTVYFYRKRQRMQRTQA